MTAAPTLKSVLREDLTTAIKARDELRSATLRMCLAAITNEEVAGKSARVLSDADVIKVLNREAKKRREAATAYEEAGRTELAERELAEQNVIAAYLPAPLSDAELQSLVTAAVNATGAVGPAAMGAVMKAVQSQVAGRADGSTVAAAVKAALAKSSG